MSTNNFFEFEQYRVSALSKSDVRNFQGGVAWSARDETTDCSGRKQIMA
jgi:hypothetical protein